MLVHHWSFLLENAIKWWLVSGKGVEASQGILGVLTWQPKIDGWKITFPFGAQPIFRGELLVSGRVTKKWNLSFAMIMQHFFLQLPLYTLPILPYIYGKGGAILYFCEILWDQHISTKVPCFVRAQLCLSGRAMEARYFLFWLLRTGGGKDWMILPEQKRPKICNSCQMKRTWDCQCERHLHIL